MLKGNYLFNNNHLLIKKQDPQLYQHLNNFLKKKPTTDVNHLTNRNVSMQLRKSQKSIQDISTINRKSKKRTFSDQKRVKKAQVQYIHNINSQTNAKPRFQIKRTKKSMGDFTKNVTIITNAFQKNDRKYHSQSPKKMNTIKKLQSIKQIKTLNSCNDHNQKTYFEEYMKFICAENAAYYISLDFDIIRSLSRAKAWEMLDIKNVKVIENLMLGVYEHLCSPKPNSKQIIMQFCHIYFNNYEKVRLQVILVTHYFRMFAFKLKNVFIYQKLVMYFIFTLAKLQYLFEPFFGPSLLKILKHVQQIYTSLILSVIQMEKVKDTRISQTFQILKSVSQMERRLSFIQAQFKNLPINQIQPLVQITRHFRPFIIQSQIRTKSQEYITKLEMILSWKHLKVPPTPFLPGIKSKQYTLVLDLDETIIHFQKQSSLLKYRPHMDMFLNALEQNFQLIIFTASSKEYADIIIKQIENKKKLFNFRLYREHLTLFNGRMIKDITRLGRDLSKTIIIDNLKVNFSNCPLNGIEVSTWTGNKKDRQLAQILPFIQQIPLKRMQDVRQHLQRHRKLLNKIVQTD